MDKPRRRRAAGDDIPASRNLYVPLTLDHVRIGTDPAAIMKRHGCCDRTDSILRGMKKAFEEIEAGRGECSECEAAITELDALTCVSIATLDPGGDVPKLCFVLSWCHRCATDEEAVSGLAKAYLRDVMPGGVVEPHPAGHA